MKYRTFVVTYKTSLGKTLKEEVTARDVPEARKNFTNLFGVQKIILVMEKTT